jgi:hypothetical protein
VTTVTARAGASRDRRGVTWPLVLAASVLGVSVLLHLRDPHRSGSWGYCPWFLLTGTYCPGCGGLRAVNDLTHGDLRAAASSNLLLVGSLPFLAAWWARWTLDRWRGVLRHGNPRLQVRLAWAFLALALCFAVLRNTPLSAWLAP